MGAKVSEERAALYEYITNYGVSDLKDYSLVILSRHSTPVYTTEEMTHKTHGVRILLGYLTLEIFFLVLNINRVTRKKLLVVYIPIIHIHPPVT
jgi:hypothetical protein